MKLTDQLIHQQEAGVLKPGEAARRLTGKTNGRSSAYAKFWLRHLQLVAERRMKKTRP